MDVVIVIVIGSVGAAVAVVLGSVLLFVTGASSLSAAATGAAGLGSGRAGVGAGIVTACVGGSGGGVVGASCFVVVVAVLGIIVNICVAYSTVTGRGACCEYIEKR